MDFHAQRHPVVNNTIRNRNTRHITLQLALASALGLNTAYAGHGSFTTSNAIYRIPYADGTAVTANNDHHNHPNVPNRVDLGGGDGSTIVAAASGIIRAIVDRHGNSNGLGDGLSADGNSAHDDSTEHSCLDDDTVIGDCSDYNNYVWIQHSNGEWTKYTHFATGSVTANNWQVGDTILVGQALGAQSDVGSASGSHLHHEVAAIPDSEANCPGDCPFSALGGFVNSSWNVVARVCFSNGDDDGDGLYTDGEAYIAGPCVNTAPTAEAGGPYVVNEGSTVLLDGSGSSDPENALLIYSWAPAAQLDNAASATPLYSGVDDMLDNLTLTVSDLGGDVTVGTALTDSDDATITVVNVAPSVLVSIVTNNIDEGSAATITASITDPGAADTHTATVDWADGSPLQAVSVAQLAAGVAHVYGDNGVFNVTVTATDDDGGVGDHSAPLTVLNVAPTVDATATVNAVDEGQSASVSATFTDPGFLDTHTASIDWDDGNGPQAVELADLAAGVQHEYGDNGNYDVVVTVTDDDGGSGDDVAGVAVSNVDPVVSIDLSGAISFPGGDYLVVKSGTQLPLMATGSDAGSDDLSFAWNTGDSSTHFNNGVSPDLPNSPGPVYPFQVDDAIDALYMQPGVIALGLDLSDDDNGLAMTAADVIVTGTADQTQGLGWWKHQYSGNGAAHIDAATAAGYLDIVNAVSGVFSETTAVTSFTDLHQVLSPKGGDKRAAARAELMLAWLQFASGAVLWNAPVDGITYLELMFLAEAIITDPGASNASLQSIQQRLAKTRHAQ